MFRDLSVRSWTLLFVGWKEPFGSRFAFSFFLQQPFPSNTFCISPVSMQRSSRVSRFFVSRFPVFGNFPAFPFLRECLRGGVLYSLDDVEGSRCADFSGISTSSQLSFSTPIACTFFFHHSHSTCSVGGGSVFGSGAPDWAGKVFWSLPRSLACLCCSNSVLRTLLRRSFALCKNLVNTEYETIITTIITAEKDD